MSPTLLEGAIAVILLIVAWGIGSALTPYLLRRFRSRKNLPNRKDKPPRTIDI
jgi:hypothetical protein